MNWLDVVIILVFIWFTYSAFNAGLIREVITIAGAIFAVALAGLFFEDLARDINVAIEDEESAKVISFIVIFGATVLASQLLALFLKEAASLLMLGLMDSLGGAIFGFLKAFIFVEMALILALRFPDLGLDGAARGSLIAPFFLDIVPILTKILPDEFKAAVDTF